MGVVAEENGRAEAKVRPGSLAMYTNSPGGVGHLHLKSLFRVRLCHYISLCLSETDIFLDEPQNKNK